MKKIAFLFLIYEVIHMEELWNIFFSNVDKNKYSIYIHYKYNVPLKYFEKYKITNCVPTEYADVSLVTAQNILLREALLDADNQHFIFVSNSCIPLKNFDTIYNTLDASVSYFNICPQSQCFPRCDSLEIDKKYIQKQSQWCILNRKHSIIMVNDAKYIDLYKNIYAPDELVYITNIFINNMQHEIITTPNVSVGATTFTNWEGMDYKYPCIHGLKNYSFISQEEVNYLLDSKSLFGRKFNRECITSFIHPFYLNSINSVIE